MHFKPILKTFSSVGGGPLARMVSVIQSRTYQAKEVYALSPEQWRSLFSKGKWGRLLARGLSFGAFPVMTLAQAIQASLTAKPLEKPVLITSTNPFFLPHFMVATRFLHRCSVVALMYDMYPDALEVAGVEKKWLFRLMTAANRWMVAHADGIVYIGDVLKESAESRYGANPNTWVIPTGANVSEFNAIDHVLDADLSHWMEGRCIFSYVGNMGLMHDVETLEKAVPAFIAALDETQRNRVGFVIAASGAGEARLRESWKNLEDNVRFIGPQPDKAWAELLSRTDIALATLTQRAWATSVPSKVYSALAAKCIPLIVAPEKSDVAHLIVDNACGIVVEPGDIEGLETAMQLLVEDWQTDQFESTWMRKVWSAALANDLDVLVDWWIDCAEKVVDLGGEAYGAKLYHAIKRTFDVAAVMAGLSVIWPIMLGTAIAVKLHLGSPILFKQTRPGLDGKPFELFKFRSMANAPEGTDATHDGERLSAFGKKIRALSLDEFPTLFNVLKGDMSLVGPRPLLMSYLSRYNEHQMKRQWAKPGVTGWAQVNGRNALSWQEKFDYDVWYVENASCWLDLKILLKTVWTVLRRSGIEHANSATMPEFMGN